MSDQEGEEHLDVDEEGSENGGKKRDDNQNEDENDEKDPDNPLNQEQISKSLSLLCKTGDGLSHAYVNLDCREKELSDIGVLAGYIHLRYLDISKNFIRDISSVSNLTHLLVLKADYNKLSNIQLEELPFLQVASFSHNRIKSTEGLNHPHLEHLNLNYNRITEIEGMNPQKLSKLHTLELRGNKLRSLKGVNAPNLKNFFAAANPLTTIEGMEGVNHLTTLHLRECQIENLDGFTDEMRNLQYVNLKSNLIQDVKEVKKLQVLPKLRAVVLKFNPMSGEDDYRLEVLIALRRIERLDKDEYADDERQEAEDTYEQRRLEELAKEGNQEVISTDNEED